MIAIPPGWATPWDSPDASKVRIATLEAECADLRTEARTARELMYAVTEDRDALKADWTASAIQADHDFNSMTALSDLHVEQRDAALAERDRLKAALEEIATAAEVGLNIGPVIRIAQRALAPSVRSP